MTVRAGWEWDAKRWILAKCEGKRVKSLRGWGWGFLVWPNCPNFSSAFVPSSSFCSNPLLPLALLFPSLPTLPIALLPLILSLPLSNPFQNTRQGEPVLFFLHFDPKNSIFLQLSLLFFRSLAVCASYCFVLAVACFSFSVLVFPSGN